MTRSPAPSDWFLLALLVAAWGSSFAMTKIAVGHFDAAWVMALRLTIAAGILVPYAFASGHSLAAPRAVWAKFWWLGFAGHAGRAAVVIKWLAFQTATVGQFVRDDSGV